jgi:hypothetical protein
VARPEDRFLDRYQYPSRRVVYHDVEPAGGKQSGIVITMVRGNPRYNQPLVRAILAASTRLLAPSLLIASER